MQKKQTIAIVTKTVAAKYSNSYELQVKWRKNIFQFFRRLKNHVCIKTRTHIRITFVSLFGILDGYCYFFFLYIFFTVKLLKIKERQQKMFKKTNIGIALSHSSTEAKTHQKQTSTHRPEKREICHLNIVHAAKSILNEFCVFAWFFCISFSKNRWADFLQWASFQLRQSMLAFCIYWIFLFHSLFRFSLFFLPRKLCDNRT